MDRAQRSPTAHAYHLDGSTDAVRKRAALQVLKDRDHDVEVMG